MNKEDLVNALSTKLGSTKIESDRFLKAFISIVSDTLSKQQEVTLIGFGKFYTTTRKATKGKNPRTGEAIDIPSCCTPRFKAGKQLKDIIKK